MNRTFNEEKMFTLLRGFFNGANMSEAMRALTFAREKHQGQFRIDGTPYIVHPLQMTCYAVGIGIRREPTLCTILLHDICEDCGILIDALPFGEEVKKGVKYMTIQPQPNEDKLTTKKRYFRELLESRDALICKGIDRYSNLKTMAGIMPESSIRKNVRETRELLLPVMREAKEKWPELTDVIFVLRDNIIGINETLAAAYGIEANC